MLATIAIVGVFAGGAYAGSKIGTSDIKKKAVTTPKIDGKAVTGGKVAQDAIKSKKIQDESLKTDDYEPGSVTESKLGDSAVTNSKLAHPTYWAYVVDGIPPTLVRGNGAVTALRINNGNYRVEFETDISQCSYQVTPADVSQSLTAHAALDATNNQRVFISLKNSFTQNRTDGDFQVAVNC